MSQYDELRAARPEWFRTADGASICDGLRVWDHDLNAGTVDYEATIAGGALTGMEGPYWQGWFQVRRDIGGHVSMNAERLRVRHHTTGAPVPPSPDGEVSPF